MKPLRYLAVMPKDIVRLRELRDQEFVRHYSIPAFDDTGGALLQATSEIDSDKQLVQAGDLLISKLNPRKSRVVEVSSHAEMAVASTEFVCVRPRDIVGRYGLHLLMASPTRERLAAHVQSVTRSQQRVAPGVVGRTLVPVASRVDQQRIANFLDRECERIAELRTKFDRQLILLDEWFERRRTEILTSQARQPLKAVLRDASVGIVVQPARLYDQAGEVLCLRAVDIRDEALVRGEVLRIGRQAHAAHPNSALGAGDVVVVRTGKAGMAAVVPDWAVGGNCVDLLILRPDPAQCDSQFLGQVLNSGDARRQVMHASVGSIQGHMNLGAIRQLQVPRLTVEEQQGRVKEIATLRIRVGRERELALSAEERLAEYRDALITEAVTGRLDVSRLSDSQLCESAQAASEGERPEVLSA